MKPGAEKNKFPFLEDGGEMGEMIKSYDWSKSVIGTPGQWPQSLCTTLGIILHSAFPMFLFWGKDLICFYNDAFRPSLGIDGKHPAIGKKGMEVWDDIWEFVGPMINGVMETGKPVYFEDQLIGFYRNGKKEDIYWTFSYSPAYGDNNKISGVFVTCTETTAKVATIKALGESEERFRIMAENTDVLIATSDETSAATFFNKAWTDFTGRSMHELLDFGWADLVHEDDRPAFLAMYLDAFKKQEAWTGQFRMLNKEGKYRWLLAKGPVRKAAGGSFAGYISSSIDVTEQVNALKKTADNEHDLRQSEQEIRSLVESAPFPIGVYRGREMRVAFANKSIMDIWGKGNDVIGKLFSEVLPELDNQEVFKQLDETYRTGIAFHIKNQPLDLIVDGKLHKYYFNYSLTPLFDADGKVYGVMNTGVDLTELNLAKRKVEQSEQNLLNVILHAPVAMCILLGPTFIVEVANDFMIELWGKPAEDVMHKPVFEGLPDAREQGLEELLTNVYTTGKGFKADEMPVSLVRFGKEEIVYQNFVYEPYKDADGTIIGVLAISIDVTAQVLARKKIEEAVAERTKELAEANHNLQKSNAELAQFAYIASHDLQEPLRKIGIYSQMLEKNIGNNLSDQSKNYFNKIQTAANRMNVLIRDVLAYSEVTRDNELFENVDLNKIFESTKADYDLLIEQTGTTLKCNTLPVLEAIPLQMSQLFSNLIGNALKFIRKDTRPAITIASSKLTSQEKKDASLPPAIDFYKIQFADNGVGFKAEYAAQIFNIFQRLHRKSEFEGTGIGLALCKKIVLNHNGDINAAGSSENGAVFNIILPAKKIK